MAVREAMMSLSEMLSHTPSMPIHTGSSARHGSRNKSCRERERNMDIDVLPIDWKYWLMIICAPTIG